MAVERALDSRLNYTRDQADGVDHNHPTDTANLSLGDARARAVFVQPADAGDLEVRVRCAGGMPWRCALAVSAGGMHWRCALMAPVLRALAV